MSNFDGRVLQCSVNMKFGWRCTRPWHFDGPCALVPSWWNLLAKWRFRARG